MDQVTEVLTRGVANIIPGRDALETVLRSDRKLNIYLGIDPTATRIHIGHAVSLRKLQQLTDLGHHITFLIGDFTALIGDTSDKDSERPVLTSEQIAANFETYKRQASKILDFSRVTVRHNSEWLKDLDFGHIVSLTRHFSLNDFISRELIRKRLDAGRSVSLPEVLYPVMQGYDSYFMDTDLQIGGTDQTFNMQAGRTLQKDLRSKDTFVLAIEFLTGTDGRKMSKTWNNAIWLEDTPADIFGKVMSLRDDLLLEYFTLATAVTMEKIHEISARLAGGENPMTLKKDLGLQLVSELHSRAAAFTAQSEFENTIQNRQYPDTIPTHSVGSSNIVDILVETGLVASKSSARRLIEQGGVKSDNEKITSFDAVIPSGAVVSVGARNFVRVEKS